MTIPLGAKQFVRKRYTVEEFVGILMQHVPDRGGHAMRYFGLLAPRCKARTWAAIFLLLKQQMRSHPPRPGWRWLLRQTFGVDPLLDSTGRTMRWVGRRNPITGRLISPLIRSRGKPQGNNLKTVSEVKQ